MGLFQWLMLALTVMMLVIAIGQFLARRRANQVMKEVHKIGKDTKSITEKLATESYIRERATRLFQLDESINVSKRQYKIIYPVKYNSRPLPLIYQGDFYAIHILSLVLDIDKVDLIEIKREQKDILDDYLEGNIIFICTPQVNHALNRVFPYASTIAGEEHNLQEGFGSKVQRFCKSDDDIRVWLRDIKLPCWFIDEYKTPGTTLERDESSLVKKIQIYDKDDEDRDLEAPLQSAAERYYIEARELGVKKRRGKVGDLGIFARITKSNNSGWYMVIAGIHQYGTWIVADFLNNLLRKESTELAKFANEEQMKVFNSNNDFIATITGKFSHETITVENSMVDHLNLWTRKRSDDHWVRYDRMPT